LFSQLLGSRKTSLLQHAVRSSSKKTLLPFSDADVPEEPKLTADESE